MKKFLLGLIGFNLLIAQNQEPSEVKEYEIKEKFRGEIKERKRPWKLFYDPVSAAYEPFEEKGYIYDERFGQGIIKPPLPSLASDELRKAWLQSIVREEVGLFHPFYGRDVTKWAISILDSKGKTFRTYSGEGIPPRTIKWDGRNNEGKPLDVSLKYFYTASVQDEAGNVVKTPEKPIKLKGILFEEGVQWVVSLDGNEVFSKNSSEIAEYDLLEEAKSIIKQKARAKVQVKVYGQDARLTRKRLEILTNWLRENLILPKGRVLYLEGYFERTGHETARVDFIIL